MLLLKVKIVFIKGKQAHSYFYVCVYMAYLYSNKVQHGKNKLDKSKRNDGMELSKTEFILREKRKRGQVLNSYFC